MIQRHIKHLGMTYRLIFILIFVSGICSAEVKRLIIFGDSLSDQGKIYEFFHDRIPVSPPYWYGRFSNGPVWTDYVAKQFIIQNLSEGGATLVDYSKYSHAITYLYITFLSEEISHFLKQDEFLPTDLIIIWLGGNDYIAYHWTSLESVFRAVRELYLEILRIRYKGARQVLVINLPDLGATPLAAQKDNSELLHQVTLLHNKSLEDTLLSAFPSEFIRIYDAYSIFNKMLIFPTDYGFTDTTNPCYTGSQWRNRLRLSQSSDTHEENTFQKNIKINNSGFPKNSSYTTPSCEGMLFFDALHPTTFAHKFISEKLVQFIEENYQVVRRASSF